MLTFIHIALIVLGAINTVFYGFVIISKKEATFKNVIFFVFGIWSIVYGICMLSK